MINIDAVLSNADWPKRTPDLIATLRTAREYARDKHGEFAPTDDRVARAIANYKPSTRATQLIAARSEKVIAKALGGEDLPDNEPMDVIGPGFGVEVKTIIDNNNDKLTMHPESRRRKEAFVRTKKLAGHTVAVDVRTKPTTYYYRAGFGAFRLGSMQKVSLTALRGLIR